MKGELIGTNIYLRFGAGPVQCFRVWEPMLFFTAREEDGAKAKPPFDVTVCAVEDYRRENWRKAG